MAINLEKPEKTASEPVKCGYTHCRNNADMSISDTHSRYDRWGKRYEVTNHYCSDDCKYSAMYARD